MITVPCRFARGLSHSSRWLACATLAFSADGYQGARDVNVRFAEIRGLRNVEPYPLHLRAPRRFDESVYIKHVVP